ncbi:MAG TPA: molybdopterin cofactor-binding domain-containing protein [Burkholderiales bacterium]|nr:molybdopterin cofactor-binding domain-containing protein [Burkholderiales bacterium]
MNVLGKPRRRVDGRAKVTGLTKFADDIVLPRMLHMKLLRSPHAHAKIESIDCSKARKHPGVHLVLTGKDFPITFGILPVTQDEYPLAPEHVRYVGDPVAAVVAKDEQTAVEALDLIDVRYKILTTISTPEEALQNPEPRIHAYSELGNIHRLQAFEFGDVEESFKKSDFVFEDLFFYEGNTHLPIEQHATVAALDGEGKLTLWSSTQVPHYVHRSLARVLRLSPTQIRVIATPNGGGFGGKCDVCNHEMVAGKAAVMLGRPVKICLNREEVFYMHRGRHPVLMKMRTGVTKEGKLTGMHVQTLVDGGGYGSYGVASTFYTGALQTVTYELPRYKFDAARVFTNKPPCGPKRGHGTPQPRFGQEVQLDKIAEALGVDPAELRLQSVLKANALTANWLKIGSIGLAECIRQVVQRSDWNNRYKKLPVGKGLGLACGSYLCGAGLPVYWNKMPQTGVQLLIDRSGQVTVFCGATEIGQGSDDVLVAIVAEVLGVDPLEVRCVTGDTGITPVDLGSYSSRVTVMMGNAAIQASQKLKDLIATAAAEQLEVAPDRLTFANGKVFFEGKSITFVEAVGFAEEKFGTLGSVGSYKPPRSPGRYKGAGVGPSPAYSYTACVVEAEVDPGTGWITVPKIWIAHDIGRTINPVLARGQVEGSVYMGLSEALMEEQVFRRLPPKLSAALVHKIPSLLEYKSLTSLDMPEVDTVLVEDPDPNCPFGAKEAGQGPLLPVMPAVANAIYDAVGVRIDELPITPDKVLRALQMKSQGKEARVGPTHFPEVPYPEPIVVPPPWEGGDGNAVRGLGKSGVRRAEKFA